MKVVVIFLKGWTRYVKGDITQIDTETALQLEKSGVIKLYTQEDAEKIKQETLKIPTGKEWSGENIKGEKYIKGKVDVVVPTREKYTPFKSVFVNDFSVITRDFNLTGRGFACSCNEGAKINKGLGEFILFLNDDVIIKNPDMFLNDIINGFADDSVAMVGTNASKMHGIHSNYINGAVMCIRREAFEKMGGFDEDYFFMWEDNDICENVLNHGWKINVVRSNASHSGRLSKRNESDFWITNYENGKERFENKWKGKKRFIGSCIVGNENGKYLIECVSDYIDRKLVDYVDIVCDNSNEETMQEIEELKKKYSNIKVHYHDFQLFGYAENKLRERAIDYALSQNPYAIIPFDADEKWEEELTREKAEKLLKKGESWDLLVAHYWDSREKIRIDGIWGMQKNVRLFKVNPKVKQTFYNKNLHCGSAPIYAYNKRQTCAYVFKHYGHMRKEDREKKVQRQKKFDPHMKLENAGVYMGDREDNVKTELYDRNLLLSKWKDLTK